MELGIFLCHSWRSVSNFIGRSRIRLMGVGIAGQAAAGVCNRGSE